MEVDELPASILNLSLDVWSSLAPLLSFYEIFNLTLSSPAMRTRLSRSVRALEVCTSFRDVDVFPTNFVSLFPALEHLSIGLAEPHPDHEVTGLTLAVLPPSLTSLELRNYQVLASLFRSQQWTSGPSPPDLLAPHLTQLKYLYVEAWGQPSLAKMIISWLKDVICLPQLTRLFLPGPISPIRDVLAAPSQSLLQLDFFVNCSRSDLEPLFKALPSSITHLTLNTFVSLTSQEAGFLPTFLAHLRLENVLPPDSSLPKVIADDFLTNLPPHLQSLDVVALDLDEALDKFYGALPRSLTSLRMSDIAGSEVQPRQWAFLPKSLTNFPLHIGTSSVRHRNEHGECLIALESLDTLHAELDANIRFLPTALREADIPSPLPRHITSLPCLDALCRLTVFYPSVDTDCAAFDPNDTFVALASLPVLDSLRIFFGEQSYPSIPLGRLMANFNHSLSELSFQNVWFSPAHYEFDFSQIWAKRLHTFCLDRPMSLLDDENAWEKLQIESVSNEVLASLPHSLAQLSLTRANVDNLHDALECCPPYLTSLAIGATDVEDFNVASHHLTHLRIINNCSDVLRHISIAEMLGSVGEHIEALHLHNIELAYENPFWRSDKLPPVARREEKSTRDDDDSLSEPCSEEDDDDDFSESFADCCEEPLLCDRYGPEVFDYMPLPCPIVSLIEDLCPNLRVLEHGRHVERIYRDYQEEE